MPGTRVKWKHERMQSRERGIARVESGKKAKQGTNQKREEAKAHTKKHTQVPFLCALSTPRAFPVRAEKFQVSPEAFLA